MISKSESFLSTAVHRYLRIPYTLHAHTYRSPKKYRATYVFIHGIGNTLHAWDEVAAGLPHDVKAIGIDLLGFGQSPKPHWEVYSAKTQARSVALTLVGLGLTQPPIIVGHSLGALVAVELAKRYRIAVRGLVLCSPPFYKPEETSSGRGFKPADDVLRALYKAARRHPQQLLRLSPLAVKLGLANKSLSITDENVAAYLGALEASIVNQTSLRDVSKLQLPITIFYGTLDPVVIKKHIVRLAKTQANVRAIRLIAGHEVLGGYAKRLAAYLSSEL